MISVENENTNNEYWAEEYYNMILDEAYNNGDKPDNNGYYL